MKILVVGGGIAGLTVAKLLAIQNHKVTLIEKAHAFRTMGFGISLWPSGQTILQKLGVLDEVLKKSLRLKGYKVTNKQGRLIHDLDFKRFFKQYGPILGVARPYLHKILVRALRDVPVHFDTQVIALKETQDGVYVSFNKRRSGTFDLVIGADGVHSAIRQLALPEITPQPSGWTSWLFWLPEKFPHPRDIRQMIGPNAFVTFYPLSETQCGVYLAAAVPPGLPDSFHTHADKLLRETRLKEYYKDFAKPVPEILDSVDRLHVMFHDDIRAIHTHTWFRGRVVLVGDAEHALSPLTGMGCSMALEDAWVLAEELNACTAIDDLPTALQNYQARRQPRIEHLQHLSHFLMSLVAVKQPWLSWTMTELIAHILPGRFITQAFERFAAEKI